MKLQIKNNVSWIGKIDWELRKFHGDEYSTHRGSTLCSYGLMNVINYHGSPG
jgi:flavorubredoxin